MLLKAAKTLRINTDQFNTNVRVNGRDYMQRVKRDRHKLLYKAVSIPTRRATRLLHREIRRRLNKRELYVGDVGGGRSLRRSSRRTRSQLQVIFKILYGRKFPLDDIRHQIHVNEDQTKFKIRWAKTQWFKNWEPSTWKSLMTCQKQDRKL